MFHIVPAPVTIRTDSTKTGFQLDSCATVSPLPFATDLVDFVKKALHTAISVGNGACSIMLSLDETQEHDEGYRLTCENDRIKISAKTENGLFYGIQTLKQMLLQTGGRIPCTEITDYPRFAYRAYMLDCGRYFFPVDHIKRILDFMALHKLNMFHWHLTEDQGWRIEIKKYPLLTTKGSRRSHTNFNLIPHGGYYTQEDIKEVVAYAHARMIKVIPEFDIPGHSVAAIACYPYLSCFDRELEVATHWGVKRDILCAGKETTYRFVYDILDELMDLFPDQMIHIGGDEADKHRWKLCPHCQKAIKEKGFRDENDLQMLFMTKVAEYLSAKGYTSLMWNNDTGGGTEFLSPNVAWTVYKPGESEEAVRREIKRGRKMINSVNRPYYLNFPYGWVSLKDVCENKGAFTETDSETWGIEACMWTEYVPNLKTLEFLTFPRLGAIAENAWAPKGCSGFSPFMDKVSDYFKLLDVYRIRYAPIRKACPSFLYKHASSVWFKRRKYHWEPIRIPRDDKKVEEEARRQAMEQNKQPVR